MVVVEKFKYQLIALSFEASYLGRQNMLEGFSDTSAQKVVWAYYTPPCAVKIDNPAK